MFYYISFLRAPPRESHISHPISITCQITNDLRTELCPFELDVYYSWLPEFTDAPFSSSHNIDISKANFTKLTIWRSTNAYKEIRISPPNIVRNGQRWRLLLCHEPAGVKIDISREPFGVSPFPVVSMPILFSSGKQTSNTLKTSGSIDYGKQEEIERLFSIRFAGADSDVAFVIREKLSFDLDKKLWDSGIGISSWLVSSLRAVAPQITNRLFDKRTCNVLELGSGTGIASIVLAALISHEKSISPSDYDSKIVATDLPSAMELIEHNLTANNTLFSKLRPQAVVLDWDEDNLPSQINDLGQIDLILMADVTYNTSSFPSLIKTLLRLRQLNAISGADSPDVMLGYKERDPEERTLWDMLANMGLGLKEIDRVEGAGGAPVEVYLGKFEDRAS